jgi:hypothetical protein
MSTSDPQESELRSKLEVAAPLVIVTSLLMYIGWARTRAYYG